MAFVPAPGASLGVNAFCGAAVSRAPLPRPSTVRMEAEPENPKPVSTVFAKSGKSQWKENSFTGGFPGGEKFFRSWAEGGMLEDVADLPETLQATAKQVKKKVKKSGILSVLDATEFFKGFSGGGDEDEDDEDDEGDEKDGMAKPVAGEVVDSAPPDPALYEQYFPEKWRNRAPMISFVYENNFARDRVSMAMREVSSSPADVYFPKEMKNKAPIIDIIYNGSLNGASVSLRMNDIEGLPTLPPPPKKGDAVTELVPGSGGGWKLSYSVAGQGPVDI